MAAIPCAHRGRADALHDPRLVHVDGDRCGTAVHGLRVMGSWVLHPLSCKEALEDSEQGEDMAQSLRRGSARSIARLPAPWHYMEIVQRYH